MADGKIAIIGAGIGGLVAATLLAARGIEVVLIERSDNPGGKMRQINVAGRHVDAGPTVFTMRGVFDEIFAAAGASLSDFVTLQPATVLARHTWSMSERLDLFADPDRSADAIGDFAGAREAAGYRAFCARARQIFEALEQPFICSQRPNLATLIAAFGLHRLGDLFRISPFVTLWSALGEHFRDPRLRQLFGRYATYCGSSPFQAPATLMLVAHVESEGVWLLDGGMHQLAQALATLATRCGATLRFGCEAREINVQRGQACGVTLDSGEHMEAAAIIVNADAAAIGAGLFGESAKDATLKIGQGARSLSAVTWTTFAKTNGVPLARHNVFFSRNYQDEFERIRRGKLPLEPTVYVCAQDRTGTGHESSIPPGAPEALLCLVNAPPNGDESGLESAEIDQCEERTFSLLERHGLQIERHSETTFRTTPQDFSRLFPGTGGALYGPASHGWMASFRRPGSRTGIRGLYLAGGSTHPGPGVPMAAISGRLAVAAILEDLTST
jgi:1-hydroxycarotenoid 3,4-desaturase